MSPVEGRPPRDPEDKTTISLRLFESAHVGMGDATLVQEHKYNRIHGSIDPRWPGELRMGMQLREGKGGGTYPFLNSPPVFATAWEDANGLPLVYAIHGDILIKFTTGKVSSTDNFWGSGNVVTDGMLYDSDGVPYLFVGFGGVTGDTNIKRMNRAATASNSPVTLVADKLLSLNGKAYRTITPTSGTANCQVSVLPQGSDPFANPSVWGAGQTVGFAGTHINALAAVRQAPVAIKPEGVFGYNEALDRWVNYTPSWERFQHEDNGKGAFSLGDLLIIPMGDGGMVMFDGFTVRPYDPVSLESTPNEHTTRAQVDSIGTTRHWAIAATGLADKKILAGNTQSFLFEDSGGSFTDHSSAVRDTDTSTKATITYDNVLDFIWIGWDRPFAGVRLEGLDAGTANSVSRSLSTWIVVTSGGGVEQLDHVDFTQAATGVPLGQDGEIILSEDPISGTASPWVKSTINSIEKYWLRLRFTGALTASITIDTCYILPWYPSVDPTNFPLDGLDKSGCFPHILFGRSGPQGQMTPIWHDMLSLSSPDKIGPIVLTNIGTGPANNRREILMFGQQDVWRISLAADDRPGTEAMPFLNDTGLFEASSLVPMEGKICRLIGVKVNGHSFDPDLVGRFYFTWDHGKPWTRAGPTVLHAPAEGLVRGDNRGSTFRWAFGWKQSSTGDQSAMPVVNTIDAEFEVLGDPLDSVVERAVQNTIRI